MVRRAFARDKRHLYFEATSGTRADQLADFSDRLPEATGRASLTVPDWRGFAEELVREAEVTDRIRLVSPTDIFGG